MQKHLTTQLIVPCPGCGTHLKAPADLAGQPASCPHCQGTLSLPPADQAPYRFTEDDLAKLSNSVTVSTVEEDDPDQEDDVDFRLPTVHLPWHWLGPVLTVAAILFGGWHWWTTYGPGNRFEIVEIKAVHSEVALDTLKRLGPIGVRFNSPLGSSSGGGGNQAAAGGGGGNPAGAGGGGATGPSGGSNPAGGSTPLSSAPGQGSGQSNRPPVQVFIPGLRSYENHNTLGGSDQLVLSREAINGDHLILRLRVTHGFMAEAGLEGEPDVLYLGPTAFKILGGGNGEVVGTVLRYELENGFVFSIGAASTDSIGNLLPSGVKPAKKTREKSTSGQAGFFGHGLNVTYKGRIDYDGSNGVTGSVTYQSFPATTPMSSPSIRADGTLNWNMPSGAILNLQYTDLPQAGNALVTTWNQGTESYWGLKENWVIHTTVMDSLKSEEVILLFDRPTRGTGDFVLKIGGTEVTTLPSWIAKPSP